jgi:hypothetical protein
MTPSTSSYPSFSGSVKGVRAASFSNNEVGIHLSNPYKPMECQGDNLGREIHPRGSNERWINMNATRQARIAPLRSDDGNFPRRGAVKGAK